MAGRDACESQASPFITSEIELPAAWADAARGSRKRGEGLSRRGWILTAAAVLALLPVGLLGAALALFNPNDWKPEIEAAVRRATGRQLIIDGPIRISRSLWPTIEASRVTLANLPGGSRPDMIRLDSFKARVSLLALLHRSIDIPNLTLVGPNILFEEVDHQPNWLFAQGAAAKPHAGRGGAGGFTLNLRTIHIINGMVTFHLPARTNVIGIRRLVIHQAARDAPVVLTSTLVYGDYAPFTLDVTAREARRLTDPWTARMDFAAYGATAHAEGRLSLGGDFDLAVTAAAPALEKLNALYAPMQLPPLHDFALTTHIRNGPERGDIPVIGATRLSFGSADLSRQIPGLVLGAVSLALDKPGGTASLAGKGSYQKVPFALSGSVAVPEHLDGSNSLAVTLKASALTGDPARLSLSGKLALDTTAFAGLDARVDLSTPRLARLRRLISPALPALTDARFTGTIALPKDLAALRIIGGALSAREGDIAGDARFGLAGTVDVAAKLTASRLNLDALLKALGLSLGGGGKSPARGPVFSTAPLPWESLRGPDLAISAAVKAMTFQGQSWRDVGLSVRLKDGRLALDRMELALPGGPVEASFSADAAARVPQVHLTLHAPDIPLGLIIHRLGLPGPAEGRLVVNADLSAAGRSAHALASSLTGSLAARMGAGSLSNAALSDIAGAALSALHVHVPPEGRSIIRCLAVDGRFAHGIGQFGVIAVNSTYLNVDGAGEVDLGHERVALKLHPMARVAGSSVAVPVEVAGPFRDVTGRLDAGVLQKVGFFFDGLFGGDRTRGCAT